MFPRLLSLIEKEIDEKNTLTKTYIDCLKSDTPDIEKINAKDNGKIFNSTHLTYPVLFITIGLQEKITELFKQLEE